jgi:hypothetical protein
MVEFDLSISTKHSPSCKDNSPAASHTIPHTESNPTVHHRFLFLSWAINMVHTVPLIMHCVRLMNHIHSELNEFYKSDVYTYHKLS